MVEIIKENPVLIKPETVIKPSAGISGKCAWVLKDAVTGKVKMVGESENTILARGLDYIISHIVSGVFPGSTVTEGQSSTYHGQVTGSNYIVGMADYNPFKYLVLLMIYDSGITPTFSEGIGNTSYYVHKNTGTDGMTGIDVVTYNENLGDSGAHNGSSHSYSTDPSNRTKILGWKILADRNVQQSIQSNEDGSILHFEKVSIVFNFTIDEGNAPNGEGINSIAWADSAECKIVGARLAVSPMIPKTVSDTLDITYTFDLSVT